MEVDLRLEFARPTTLMTVTCFLQSGSAIASDFKVFVTVASWVGDSMQRWALLQDAVGFNTPLAKRFSFRTHLRDFVLGPGVAGATASVV